MEKVYVMDNRGREKVATKIAYFKTENKKYFIYTLDEADKDGYLKLYIKQFENGEDIEIPDIEWEHVKSLVQEVLRQMRDGVTESYEALDRDDVTEVMESGSRVFKLKKDIVRQIQEQDINDSYKFDEVNDFNDALIEAFKKATLKSEVKTKVEDKKIEKEKSFMPVDSSDADDILLSDKIETPDIETKNEPKIKPFVVSNVPILEYQETILRLEQDAKKVQELCRNLKNENDRLVLENDNLRKTKRILESEKDRLQAQLEQYKTSVDHYQETLEHLKDIMRGLE